MGFTAEEYILEMEEHLGRNELVYAYRALDKALELEPGYALAHYHAGCMNWYRMKNAELAKYHLKLAIKFNPFMTDAYTDLLYIANLHNDVALTEELVEQALSNNCVSKVLLYEYAAVINERNGDYEKALAAFENAALYCTDGYKAEEFKNAISRINAKRDTVKARELANRIEATAKPDEPAKPKSWISFLF